MQKTLLDILVDPIDRTRLTLDSRTDDASDSVLEGVLRSSSGHAYPVRSGIPRFVLTEDSDQQQTQGTFSYKWQKEESYGSEGMQRFYEAWMLEKYGFVSHEAAQNYFGQRERILDAGCGAGFPAAFWIVPGWQQNPDAAWVGLDISTAIDAAQKRLGYIRGTHFVQGDILQLPFAENSFDTIFSEGVLHHTPSTEKAFKSLVPLLRPGGEIMFYVYRLKSPIREFSDDYIRSVVADLPPEEAWEMMRPLTKLAQVLTEKQIIIDVPEAIPYLGIKAGPQDIQRLIYWNVAKMFWNSQLSFEENLHINFDWYHPRYAHRQSAEQIQTWCADCNLQVVHFHEQESGYTVRAVKQ